MSENHTGRDIACGYLVVCAALCFGGTILSYFKIEQYGGFNHI